MEIACMLNTHDDPDLTKDTADSIQTWMTENIMVLVDGAGWHHFEKSQFPYPLYRGLVHGRRASPFRNILHGFVEIYKRFDVDWYCYLEADCLVVGRDFKRDLKRHSGKWIGGTNYRADYPTNLPLLNKAVEGVVSDWHYFLGAVMFLSHEYMKTLIDNAIPQKIIEATKGLPSGDFPGYSDYAFEEHLFVSLANYYRPNSYFTLSPWNRYNVRFEPDVRPTEVTAGTSIIHPIKRFQSPVRQHFRAFRDRLKNNDRRTKNNRT